MESKEFQKLLLRTAILAMSADGNIQTEEVEVVSKIAQNTNYFVNIDLYEEIKSVIDEINLDFKSTFQKYISFFESNYLTVPEILLLFEILLMIINADMIITNEEKFFVKSLRSKFKYVPNDIFISRFGENEYFNLETENPYIAFQKPNIQSTNIQDFLDGEVKEIEKTDI